MRRFAAGVRRVAAFCVPALVSVALARHAGACAPPFGESSSLVSRVVPSNGVLLVEAQCFQCEQFAQPTSLTVKDASDNDVSGSIVDSGAAGAGYWLAFKPDSPWMPNAEYGLLAKVIAPLSGTGLPRDTRLAFTTGAEATFDAAALSVGSNVSALLTLAGDTHCCKDAFVTSCGSTPWCVYDDEWARAELKLSVTTPADSEGQYAYRAQWLGDGAERGTSEWAIGRELSFVYDEPATEYCGQVSVKSLVDGVVSEIGPFCAKFTDPVALGMHPWPDAQVEQILTQCQSPPESHLARWCELSVVCTTDDCRAAQAQCASAAADDEDGEVDEGVRGVEADDDEGATCAMAARRDSKCVGVWIAVFAFGLRRSGSCETPRRS